MLIRSRARFFAFTVNFVLTLETLASTKDNVTVLLTLNFEVNSDLALQATYAVARTAVQPLECTVLPTV